ncbi:RluA family pseudouridine synthase [uncultured Treponema sp.]|uniref:RluA family pseudouridine synthase n=1 Tax=uncultured Treponema sp. TaxID=162155 RepID=UPI0025E39004|nr:RluA family pseudouridine synthase [uncultured Treponema sp.]
MPFFTAKIPSDFKESIRLDKYIASIPAQDLGGISMNRSKLKSGVTEILLNGKKAKISSKVKAGDVIDLQWEDNVPENIEPEDIPLDIIYEDENVTVVNKKQGMVTHPAAGNWSGTLVNALLFHWGRKAIEQISENDSQSSNAEILAKRRPGIIHRLDKDTSGIIITAKNRNSEEFLHNEFLHHNRIIKEYIAICCGRPKILEGKIITQIIRDPKDRKRFKAVCGTEEGKKAVTIYKCLATYGPFSLMRLRIKTGRTHQIRVHMKYLGCPVMGDPIYGNYLKGSPFEKAPLMLHSCLLKIHLPGQKELTTFKTETPVRFKKVLKTLHEKYGKSEK